MKRILNKKTIVIVWATNIIVDFFKAYQEHEGDEDMMEAAKDAQITQTLDGSRIIAKEGDYVELWQRISKKYPNNKFVISYVEEVANEIGVSNGKLEELPEEIREIISQ